MAMSVVETRRSEPGRTTALVAALLGAATDALYIAIIVSQGERKLGRVAIIATYIAAVSSLSAAPVVLDVRHVARLVMLAVAAGGFLSLGVLGLFSIGLPLFIAGLLSVSAWIRSARSVRPVSVGASTLSALAFVVAVGIPILGIAAT